MFDLIVKKTALVGQVIEDLSYEELGPQQFIVELKNSNAQPQYKEGGFFVFSNIRGGTYTLRITGQGFQSQEYPVNIPFATPLFNQPGANEVIVIVKTVKSAENKITFDEIILTKGIKKGSPVLAQGLTTALANDLEIGKATEAKLDSVAGLAEKSIVRIVRDKAVRLKFNPYFRFPSEPTRIVGKVVHQTAPDHPLDGALVRISEINGVGVVLTTVADAKVATVEIAGKKIALGVEDDIATFTNGSGDYNFYFSKADFVQSVTLSASLASYQTESQSVAINPKERKKVDFHLARL